jgi:hypothetical protein
VAFPANLALQPASPCIDAGRNLPASIVGAVDFYGQPRRKGPAVDIGAYEWPTPVYGTAFLIR